MLNKKEFVNKILVGNALSKLKELPSGSVNCCISSPPYWALRDYGTATWEGGDKDCKHLIKGDGNLKSKKQLSNTGSIRVARDICPTCGAKRIDKQLGLEPTFEEYIDKLCTIYDEVKRVLRKDGTCFINLGDTYAGGIGTNLSAQSKKYEVGDGLRHPNGHPQQNGTPAKSLCLIPQRFAIEMVNRGWILRNVIIWHKPNPMPSSAKDRFTVDFEYVYFFVKSKKYWFEPQYEPIKDDPETYRKKITRSTAKRIADSSDFKDSNAGAKRGGLTDYFLNKGNNVYVPLGRNKRTVWTIPTQPYPEAHFATFPEKLVEPMIKAGCPEFVCTKCGKAREKILKDVGEKTWIDERKGQSADSINVGTRGLSYGRTAQIEFKGYTDCGCNDFYCRNCKKSLLLDEIRVKLDYDLEQNRKELFELWVKILSSKTADILLKKMRNTSKSKEGHTQYISLVENGEKATELQGGQPDHSRLLVDNGGRQENNATPIFNGEEVRPETKTQRRSTSQKRDKRRQSTAQPRIEIKENASRDSALSILQKEFQDKITCPYCNSHQITIAHADWRPGIVLDCFLRVGNLFTGSCKAAA